MARGAKGKPSHALVNFSDGTHKPIPPELHDEFVRQTNEYNKKHGYDKPRKTKKRYL